MSLSFDPWGKEPSPVSPLQPVSPVSPATPTRVLDDTRSWLERFVCTIDDSDLDLLTLWAAHTHLVVETYTSPRLVIDSPVPGSGKTTTLEHLERLCHHPVQMASLSSPALLTRMLDAGMRTVLIDEADRSLSPDKEGVAELLAVLNSGYKRGGTRPVLVPTKDGWRVSEMPTYSPVAMAGNSPNLPEDTRSRCIRVLLMPDTDGTAEDSDWEWIDEEGRELGRRLAEWADTVRDQVRLDRPDLPDGIRGRGRERWAPLKRVAVAAGGRWPDVVDALAREDMARLELERDEGLVVQRPHVALLTHISATWAPAQPFRRTENLIEDLVATHPETWGEGSSYGRRLTPQRLGRMLATNYRIHSGREQGSYGPRGYHLAAFEAAFRRFRLGVPNQTGDSGGSGETGDCAGCAQPLALALVAAGETTHPTCEESSW